MSAHVEPFLHLIDESFEEATFLWSRWESDLSSISRNLDEVWTWTEDRLSGALDGVRLAPDKILERITGAALDSGRPRELSVLSYVLSCAPAVNARALLSRVLSEASGPRLRALIRGLEVAPLDGSFAPVTKVLSRQSPEHAAALASLKAFRRAALGDELKLAYESGDSALQMLALRAARQLPRQYAAAWVDAGLKQDDPAVRLAAMETGIFHQVPNAWREALAAVRDRQGIYANLLPIVAMLGHESEHQMIFSQLGEPTLQRAALWSLGSIGTVEAAQYCLAALKHPKLSRMAAEAYCAITGADLARGRLDTAEPDEPTPAFEADNLDADLVLAAHDLWPLPNPEAVHGHWNRIRTRFEPGERYLMGLPRSSQAMMQAVASAPMLRRPDWIFELAVRTDGKFDLEPRAFRVTQQRQTQSARAALGAN